MKNILNLEIDFTKYEVIEKLSYISLILLSIGPIIEYILKFFLKEEFTYYFIEINYVVGLIGLFSFIFLFKNKKIEIKSYVPYTLLLILLLLSIISTIFAKDINLAIFGDYYRREGLIVYIMYLGILLNSTIIKNEKYIINIFKIIIFSALFITILPLFNNNFTYQNFTNIYKNTNHYGYFLMISIMISSFMFLKETKYKKINYYLIYTFLTYILIKNDTFGCYLAVIITYVTSLIISIINKYKIKDIIIIILTFILISFLVSYCGINIGERIHKNNSKGIVLKNVNSLSNDISSIINGNQKKINKTGSGRGILWKEAIKYTLKHPLKGGGIENISEYYSSLNIDIDRPHNMILQVSSFIGIPGAITYIILILYLAITNLKYLNKSLNMMIYFTAMSYFISSMFGNSMYYTSPYFMILLGLLITMKEKTLSRY